MLNNFVMDFLQSFQFGIMTQFVCRTELVKISLIS